ncbi:hypothetical protein PAPYR_6968 [Paratrimastix pyriformis]|uniref:Uncharacterized protein n=1 Tax=Paratrimastix pyriformis TaxID=342808 RepID=A0ABQ8UDY3_9EUKA|nr:hypothetical protein PAPYR_6968 [Paratrimastix pyriformis]
MRCCCCKQILTTLVVFGVGVAVGMGLCYLEDMIPGYAQEMRNTNLFRSEKDPRMYLMLVAHLFYAYFVVRMMSRRGPHCHRMMEKLDDASRKRMMELKDEMHKIAEEHGCQRGRCAGCPCRATFRLASLMIPGLLMTYATMPVRGYVCAIWFFSNVIQIYVMALACAMINKMCCGGMCCGGKCCGGKCHGECCKDGKCCAAPCCKTGACCKGGVCSCLCGHAAGPAAGPTPTEHTD